MGRRHDPVKPMVPILIEDVFSVWVRFINAGMLEGGNLYCFDCDSKPSE